MVASQVRRSRAGRVQRVRSGGAVRQRAAGAVPRGGPRLEVGVGEQGVAWDEHVQVGEHRSGGGVGEGGAEQVDEAVGAALRGGAGVVGSGGG